MRLQYPRHTLHQPKNQRHDKHQNRNPKGIPLHRIPAIVPPLPQPPRLRLVKGLLQDHEAVVPEGKVLEAPVLGAQVAALCEARVEGVGRDLGE